MQAESVKQKAKEDKREQRAYGTKAAFTRISVLVR